MIQCLLSGQRADFFYFLRSWSYLERIIFWSMQPSLIKALLNNIEKWSLLLRMLSKKNYKILCWYLKLENFLILMISIFPGWQNNNYVQLMIFKVFMKNYCCSKYQFSKENNESLGRMTIWSETKWSVHFR